MSKLTFDISVSLDGFITGPDDGVDLPMGEDGERLHEWIFGLASWRERHGLSGGEINRDAEIIEESFTNAGAILMGRRMFDHGVGPWGDDPPFRMPVFVVTHETREPLAKKGGTTFTFVTDGIERALEQARVAAGGKNVAIAGGARLAQQYLEAGLLDELQLHLVPILLGDGVRLFDHVDPTGLALETTRVIESPGVTHLTFHVTKDGRDG
jgi:dihydrofolate reductase